MNEALNDPKDQSENEGPNDQEIDIRDSELESAPDTEKSGEATRIARDKQEKLINKTIRAVQQYTGPTPPASELARIRNDVGIEYVDRIFLMAEKEQEKRLEINEKIVQYQALNLTLATAAIPVIGGGALIAATVIAIYGNPAWGTAVGLSGIVASVMGGVARLRKSPRMGKKPKKEESDSSD